MVAAILLMSSSRAISLIPWPDKISPNSTWDINQDEFVFNQSTSIRVDKERTHLANVLRSYLRPSTGSPLPLESIGNIHLDHDPKLQNLGPEGYTLKISAKEIVIKSSGEAGIFYGIQTLRQLLHPQAYSQNRVLREWSFPLVKIEDQPRFKWRGVHMDVARHFMPKEFIFKFLDLMAMHKLNTFHWHLVDDHGWRIEIKQYPKLTEIGSTTDYSSHLPELATRPASQKAGGFYTQEDIREIVKYAAERYITVVPEIELPGHSLAAINAYPELGCKPAEGWDNVYNVEPETIQFLKNVLDEVLELFPSQYIHIGGDEVDKRAWKANPQVQARMKELGIETEEKLQSWFIQQFATYLSVKGRKLVGWDEILEGGLPKDATVMSWRGVSPGIEAAKAGHDVVMTPTSHAYFDYYQGPFADEEPRAFGGYIPIETVYSFEPIPTELSEEEAKHILGGQANLWSEYMPTPEQMEYMAFPRLAAMAEVLWSPKENRDLGGFMKRLPSHLERLDELGVNYRKLKPALNPIGSWKSGETGEQFQPKDWPLTLKEKGAYDAVFVYTSGSHRLDIQRVELLEDGRTVAVDEHVGAAGFAQIANRYKLEVKSLKPGATYTLRAVVRSDGGTDSNGDVFFFKT
jgi:hexosaminidase